MSAVQVRVAVAGDVEAMQRIEVRAGARFREVGMDDVADDPPPPADLLHGHVDAGLAWTAVDGDGTAVGYLVAEVVDDALHVEQVSVDPAAQGQGVGRALLDAAASEAARQGLAALTLTTFRDVPWNAPLYAHLDFRELGPDEIGPGLAAVRDREAEHGLDPSARVCMRRDL